MKRKADYPIGSKVRIWAHGKWRDGIVSDHKRKHIMCSTTIPSTGVVKTWKYDPAGNRIHVDGTLGSGWPVLDDSMLDRARQVDHLFARVRGE